jgi:hypothetical protein
MIKSCDYHRTAFLTPKNSPGLGVSPPSDNAEHNSIRFAPALLAFFAEIILSTQTSNILLSSIKLK